MKTPDIQIGSILIKVIASNRLIESFDSEVTASEVGPDLHYHTQMDEIFFIQSGNVLITVDREKIVATPGMVVRVPKMTPHAWKSHDGPCRLLVTFILGARQTMYLKESGELVRSGDSWREGIAVFQKRYDNIPLLVGAEQDAAADLESAKPHATGLSIRATGEEKRGSSRSPANEIMKWIKPAMQRTESSQTLHSSELRRMMQHG